MPDVVVVRGYRPSRLLANGGVLNTLTSKLRAAGGATALHLQGEAGAERVHEADSLKDLSRR